MTPIELRERLRTSGFPDWQKIFEIAQLSDRQFRMISGILAIDGRKLSPKLNRWVQDGNIGMTCALGQFVIFLRKRSGDDDFTEAWNTFLNAEKRVRADTLCDALEGHLSRKPNSYTESDLRDAEKLISEISQGYGIISELKNPRYLIYRSSRQLVSMLKRGGIHADCYFLERTLTVYFFPDESIVW